MGKSSIHIRPVTSGSERHNNREKKLGYVREDLQHLNSSFKVQGIAETRKFIEENVKEKTGRKMQAKATPIREGVLLIDEQHTADDLKKLAGKIEERFGIKTIQGYCHKDEGHYDKISSEWKPNYHAHMVFDWTDHSTGKSIKMSREDMSELQTMVAEELGLERGQKSTKKHIEATRYKAIKEEQDLEKVYQVKNVLPKALNTIKEAKKLESVSRSYTEQIVVNQEQLRALATERETKLAELKALDEKQTKLVSSNKALELDLSYMKIKSSKSQKVIEKQDDTLKKQEVELKKQEEQRQKQSRGFGRSR